MPGLWERVEWGAHHRGKPFAELAFAAAGDDVDAVLLVGAQRLQHAQHLLCGPTVDVGLRHQRAIVVQQQQPLLRSARHIHRPHNMA